jgi:hypothetical protein
MSHWAPKALLSALAIAAFGALGFAVFLFSPFDVGRAGMPAGGTIGGRPAAGVPELPVPPETDLAFKTSTEFGTHLRYESRLSFEDLWAFYVREMPPAGWMRSDVFEEARRSRTPQEPVLAFKSAGATCIITFEEIGVFTTSVTVLLVSSPAHGLEAL